MIVLWTLAFKAALLQLTERLFAAPGRRIQPSDVRFRVVPAYPELVDAFHSVPHRSPSDKVCTGPGGKRLSPRPRPGGPQRGSRKRDWRRLLQEPASKGAGSNSRPTVTLNLPGADAGSWGHQRSSVNINGRLPFKVCHFGHPVVRKNPSPASNPDPTFEYNYVRMHGSRDYR